MTDPTHGQDGQGDYDIWGADFGKVGIDGVTDNRIRPGRRTPAPRDQGETLRAAQIQAVRDYLVSIGWDLAYEDALAGLVDAVLAAGGLCGQTSGQLPTGGREALCTMPAGHAGLWHGDDNGTRWARNEPTPDALDQAHAAGYAAAVANLRDTGRIRTWATRLPYSERWATNEGPGHAQLADYLEAVGPQTTVRVQLGGHDITDMAAGDPSRIVVGPECTCPQIDASSWADYATQKPNFVKGYEPECPTHGGGGRG